MKATVQRSTRIHRGRVFDMHQDRVTLENGVTVDLDVIRHPGAAAVVPLIDPDTVLLLRQYRYAVGDSIIEIPAGTFDDGESALACAQRELIEETGFTAGKWEKLGELTPVPGYSDERIHLFLASDLTPDRQHLDPDEVIDIMRLSFDRAIEMVFSGAIQDAKSISGLLLGAHRTGRVVANIDPV